MLSKLLFEYTKQKPILESKHKEVLNYLKNNKNILDLNLSEIHTKINKDFENKPYNIYLTDEKLTIKNSTYKADIGFNLSFAKQSFENHFKNNIIGVSTPIFEKSSKNFFSFSDSYLSKNKEGILQISYNYPQTKVQLESIRKNIDNYKNIKDAKAYIIVNTGFINDLILKDFPAYKPTLKEIEEKILEGKKISEKLKDETIYINEFIKENTKLQIHIFFYKKCDF